MNDLQIFNSAEFGSVRTTTINGEPYFVGRDVAEALGYVNPRKAIIDHVDDEDKLQNDGVTIRDSIGREQHPTIINESGLYALVLSSKLATAKRFKHWVTVESEEWRVKSGERSVGEKDEAPEEKSPEGLDVANAAESESISAVRRSPLKAPPSGELARSEATRLRGSPQRPIPSGTRNATLSHFAGRVLKRYGLSEQAKTAFEEEAQKCDPPLSRQELDAIWRSAIGFARKVQQQEGYIPPEEYGAPSHRDSDEDAPSQACSRLTASCKPALPMGRGLPVATSLRSREAPTEPTGETPFHKEELLESLHLREAPPSGELHCSACASRTAMVRGCTSDSDEAAGAIPLSTLHTPHSTLLIVLTNGRRVWSGIRRPARS